MDYSLNPFQELYVSDSISSDHFVELFSSVPFQSVVHPLFQTSNVVLTGTQGCGKTMLLSLLRPEVREAYFRKKVPFPVVGDAKNFISAGVNLTRSAIADVAQVTLGKGQEVDRQQLPYFFADFFNYWVVRDLLNNIAKVGSRPDVFGDIVKLDRLSHFADSLARQDCWSGSLSGCRDEHELIEKIESRVAIYRRWVSGNIEMNGAPAEVANTKTSIGEPIIRTVECLKRSGVIGDVPVFIRVDQLEELHQDARGSNRELRLAFRHILNRALGNRDLRVVYRVGTRKYGWNQPDHLEIFSSGGRLEERRDYLLIDLDELFRRKENQRKWIFEQFAEDAFARRLKYFLRLPELPAESFRNSFGPSPSPQERAEYFGRSKSTPVRIEQVLALEDREEDGTWSAEWTRVLEEIYGRDPLEAVLAAAWGRQTGGGRGKRPHRFRPPPETKPWTSWWQKERMMQAILQLAARRQQRMLWWGYRDALALSSGNITSLIHICHEVWDLFLKEERMKDPDRRTNPLNGAPINKLVQAAAIQNASAVWYRKLSEQPGGDVRRRFIEHLGKLLRRKLRDDRSMSYPGANGFSIRKSELEAKEEPNVTLWRFLRDAVGYGDLFAAEHVTKNKAGEARLKFYLNPILSPTFQIPAAHTKEPLYWKMDDLIELARAAELPFSSALKAAAESRASSSHPENATQLGFSLD